MGRADSFASATSHADIGKRIKWSSDFSGLAPTDEVDGADSHAFITHTNTLSTQNTFFRLFREGSVGDTQLGAQLPYKFIFTAPGQQELSDGFPIFDHLFGIRIHLHSLRGWIGATSYQSTPASIFDFDQA